MLGRVAQAHSRPTIEAGTVLGAQIAAGRRRRGWTAEELAERLGVSVPTLRKVERGELNVALGTVLEAAVLVGVPLFGTETSRYGDLAARAATELALLPERVRERPPREVDDDF